MKFEFKHERLGINIKNAMENWSEQNQPIIRLVDVMKKIYRIGGTS